MSPTPEQTNSHSQKEQQLLLPADLEAKLRKLANLLIDRILEEHQQIHDGQSTNNGLK